MSNHKHEDRFSAAVRSVSRGCLVGTAFGDAFGIPIECKTFNELQLLRKCWIDQVLQEHPQLAPFKHQLQRQHDHIRQLEEKYHQNSQSINNSKNAATGMDQKTTSDDAAAVANNNNNSSSSFASQRFPKSLSDDVPTPKNQDLSLPSSATHDGTSSSSGSTTTTAAFVPIRDTQRLKPLDFDETKGHPFITESDDFHAGMFTDDTQLSCAVARAIAQSLIDASGGDIDDDGFMMQRVASMMAESSSASSSNTKVAGSKNNNNNNNSNTNNLSGSGATLRRAMRRARMAEDDEDAAADIMNPNDMMMLRQTQRRSSAPDDDADVLDSSVGLDEDTASTDNNGTTLSKSNSPLNIASGINNNNQNVSSSANNNNNGDQHQQLQQPQSSNNNSHNSSNSTNTNNNNTNNNNQMLRTIHDDNLVCKNPGGVVADRISFYHLAQQHVIEHQRSLVGWGGTKVAVQRLIRPVEEMREALSRADLKLSRKKELLQAFNAHRNSGNEKATGNGVLMKLTPLSLVLGLEQALVRRAQGILSKEDKKLQQSNRVVAREKLIVELTRMTHGSGDAIATALVHNEMLCSLFEDFFVSCVFTGSIDKKNNSTTEGSNKTKQSVSASSSTHHHPSSKSSKSLHPIPSEEKVHQDDAVMISNNDEEDEEENNNTNTNQDDKEQEQQEQNQPPKNPFAGSPLFDRVQSSSKRAALVAAMFQVAIDRGISFCDELSVGDVVPAVDGSRRSCDSVSAADSDDAALGSGGYQNNNNSTSNAESVNGDDDSGSFQRVSSQGAPASKKSTAPSSLTSKEDSAVTPTTSMPTISNNSNNNTSTTSTTNNNNNTSTTTTSILPECRFPESFAKIGALLKKVKDFFSELIRRHQALSEETWLQGDVFPFISKPEREQIEKTIVSVSEGGTFYCVSSFIFIWAYAACFAPACAVSCARKDVVPVAIAHSALLGGDTDSNAALIGGIFGVIFGEKSIAPHVHDLKNTEVLDEATNCLENSMNALLTGKLA